MAAATAQAALVPQPSVSGSGSGGSPDLPAAPQHAQRGAASEGAAVPLQAAAGISTPLAPAAFAAIQAQASGPGAAAVGAAEAGTSGVGAAGGSSAGGCLSSPRFRQFLALIRSNCQEFEAQGRVLRLRQYLRADVGPQVGAGGGGTAALARPLPRYPGALPAAQHPSLSSCPFAPLSPPVAFQPRLWRLPHARPSSLPLPTRQVLDAVFEALEANTRVEALYCQNFEQARWRASRRRPQEARDAREPHKALAAAEALAVAPHWPALPARPARLSRPPPPPAQPASSGPPSPSLQGMLDAQLDRLARLLRRRRIWAVNVGENFGTTQAVSAAGRACSLAAALVPRCRPRAFDSSRMPSGPCGLTMACLRTRHLPSCALYEPPHVSLRLVPIRRPGAASARHCPTPRWATCL